jgi:hypothetical protein
MVQARRPGLQLQVRRDAIRVPWYVLQLIWMQYKVPYLGESFQQTNRRN